MNTSLPRVVVIAAAGLGVAVTCAIGWWQLDRAAQKLALQDRIAVQAAKAALTNADISSYADLPAEILAQQIQRPAVVRGVWVPQATVYLDNRQMDGKVGFFVVTPLQLAETNVWIAVQRGWVARNFLNRSAVPAINTPSGPVVVQGRIAPPPSKLYELGAVSEGTIRQNLDLARWQSNLGHAVLPVTLQQTDAASEGLVRNWPTVNMGIAKHYGYAVQWFALALLLAGLTLWFQWLRPRYFQRKDFDHHV